jgi:hypothetical protein
MERLEQLGWRSVNVLNFLNDHRGWHPFGDIAKACRCDELSAVQAIKELRDAGFIEVKGDASHWTVRGDLRARIQPAGAEKVRDWEQCLGKE